MASETDDMDAAADRLEAALERIAYAAAQVAPAQEAAPSGAASPDPSAQQIAARLDELIDRLRSVLGGNAG